MNNPYTEKIDHLILTFPIQFIWKLINIYFKKSNLV